MLVAQATASASSASVFSLLTPTEDDLVCDFPCLRLQDLVEQLKTSVSGLRASLPKPASVAPGSQPALPPKAVEVLWELAQCLWNHAVAASNHAVLQLAAQRGTALESGLVQAESAGAAGGTMEGAECRDITMQEAAVAAATGGVGPAVVVMEPREVATHIAWLRHLASELAAMMPLPSNLQVRAVIATGRVCVYVYVYVCVRACARVRMRAHMRCCSAMVMCRRCFTACHFRP